MVFNTAVYGLLHIDWHVAPKHWQVWLGDQCNDVGKWILLYAIAPDLLSFLGRGWTDLVQARGKSCIAFDLSVHRYLRMEKIPKCIGKEGKR